MNQKISSPKEILYVRGEAKHAYPPPQPGLLGRALPIAPLTPPPCRYKIDIPGLVAAELLPCGKEQIETLVAIVAERSDEDCGQPWLWPAKLTPGNFFLIW